jgi:hypothetical protein
MFAYGTETGCTITQLTDVLVEPIFFDEQAGWAVWCSALPGSPRPGPGPHQPAESQEHAAPDGAQAGQVVLHLRQYRPFDEA